MEGDDSFAGLGVMDKLCLACQNLNWSSPTEIQRQALPWAFQNPKPYVCAERDIIGLAETGSGKTGAFALPILQSLFEKGTSKGFFALIGEQFDALGAGIGARSAVLVGGIDLVQQQIALAKKPHILIGTPGRVLYHLENTKGFSLDHAKFLVLDEADRLLNLDFEAEIDKILHAMPRERNTYLFSATMTKKVEKLQRASLQNPVKVEANTKYSTPKQLVEQYLFIPFRFKEVYLAFLLNEMAGHSAIVFTTTRSSSSKLAYALRNLGMQNRQLMAGFSSVAMHGEMSQAKRLGALNKFKARERDILIATDLGSRGLDIPIVDLVVNFDVPQNSKDYIHRVGRTARANKRIEQLVGKKMDEFPHDEASVMVLAERVTEALRLAAGQLKEAKSKKEGRSSKDGKKRSQEEQGSQSFKRRKGTQKKRSQH